MILQPAQTPTRQQQEDIDTVVLIEQLKEYGLTDPKYTTMSADELLAHLLQLEETAIAQAAAESERLQAVASAEAKKASHVAQTKAELEWSKQFLVVYGENPRRIGPMSLANRSELIKEIKSQIKRGELPEWDEQFRLFSEGVRKAQEEKDAKRKRSRASAPKPKSPSPPTSDDDEDQKPIGSLLKKQKVVAKPKAKIVDPVADEELAATATVKQCNYDTELASYFVRRSGKSQMITFYNRLTDLLDLPGKSLQQI